MKPVYESLSSKEGNSLLEEKLSETSSDDVFPPAYIPTIKRREWWLRICALHATLIVCYCLIITAVVTRYVTHKENLGPGLIYTPARPVLGYHLRPPIPDTTNKLHGDPFFGDPSPELDMRWNIRLESASIRLSQEEFKKYNQSSGILLGDGSGDYLATPTMYHDLHCIAAFNPTQIFGDDVTEEKGENARLSAFVGAIAVGDLVKSTLGPKGMDKILQSASTGEVMVTNDGATILKAIALDNAAAKVLVNISKVQDDEVGDGTTSVTVLAAELLREAEKLVDKKIHPQTIIEGYRIASHAALTALEKTAVDHSNDKAAFRNDLLAIARTTLSSKVLSQDRNQFAELACDAVLRMKGSTDLTHIQIIKKAGGKLSDSYLDEGFILDKRIGVNQPKRLENAKILVANTAMDTDKIKIFGARVKVESTGKLAEMEKAEREKMKAKVEKIKAHGINCFVNRQLIYNWPEQLFSDTGIISIEHADFDGIERLALVTGGEIASTFDHPEHVKLGHCDLIEEVIIGEDTLIKFSGVAAGQACTIVLRGATEQLLDEAERSLHDALAVLSQTVREPKTTLGGGCAEMVMAKAVDQAARNVAGKKAIAVDSFSTALRQLPTILADNAGLDSSDLVARLREAIYKGMTSSGLDLMTPGGGIADMREMGVIESYKLKRAVVSSASEAAELLLRVDNIIRSAPRKRERM
ncbi:T-complex protein 1 subunit beta [Xylographa opegraphella]|nr:T-complex protein 1 subunit beta [Xylographa opegraphella]